VSELGDDEEEFTALVIQDIHHSIDHKSPFFYEFFKNAILTTVNEKVAKIVE
jgi:hypothetical protein